MSGREKDGRKLKGHVLVVEDSPADRRILESILRPLGVTFEFLPDGAEALAYFEGRDGTGLPTLILLDLNLPKVDGRDVLRALKGEVRTSRVPIVAFSTSSSPDEIRDVYALRANSYLVKPLDLNEFTDVVCTAMRYWLGVSAPANG